MFAILRCSVIGDDAVFELISISTRRSKAHKAVGLIIPLDFEKLTVVEVVVFGIGDGTLWTFIFEAKPWSKSSEALLSPIMTVVS